MQYPVQLRWELSRAIYRDDASQLPSLMENCQSCDQRVLARGRSQKIDEKYEDDANEELVEIDDMLENQLRQFKHEPIVNYVLVVGATFNRVQVVQRSLAVMDEDVTQFCPINLREAVYECAAAVAIRNGYTVVVELLLPRIAPVTDHCGAIRLANRAGHARVVKLLLADPRVDKRIAKRVRGMLDLFRDDA
jgi:hypothetical protein